MQIERKEWELWKQGVYVYEALCDVSPIVHAFSKKGTKPLPYPSKPYGLEDKGKAEKIKKKEAENERLKAIWKFSEWERATKEYFEEKAGGKTNGKYECNDR